FSFDPDGDGTTGLNGDADDYFTLERIAIENYGGSRSVRHFQVLVQTAMEPAWKAIPVPGSVPGSADFNFLLSHQGGRLDVIDSQLNGTSWAAANVHDGSSQTIWLSSQANNRLDFVFDTDGDGSTGGAGDRFRFESFALENYGSSRSIRDYQVEVMTAAVPVWTKLTVPGSGSGDPGFNFLSVHEGGRLTAINRELNSTSWAAANIHDGSPNSIWLSDRQTNTLDFAFDTDLDGSPGDGVNFTSLHLQNYGSSRSVATFEIDVRRGGGVWQAVTAPGGGTVFNAAQDSAVQSWSVAVSGNVSGVRFRTLSNYGDTYTGVRELEVVGDARGPSHTFTAAQSAAEQIVNLPPAAQPVQVTAVRLRAINNYGDSSYTGAREFKVLGASVTRSTTFEATQGSAEQVFVIDPADRPTGVTAVRLQTISNYGDTYTGIRELRLLGASVSPSHTFEAADSSARQTFVLDPEDVVSGVVAVRVRTLNNHGDSSYIGAREFEVLGDPVGPSYLFSAAQGVASQSWNFTPATARLFRLHTTDNFGDTYTGAAEIGLETSLTCEALAVWHLDETSWDNVNDSSGNGYTGAAANGPVTSFDDPIVPNSPGTCRYGVFDGQDDYLSFPTLPDLTGSFTIAAWIRPNRLTGDQRIFADDRNNSGGYAFSLGDGGAGRLRFFSRRVSPVSLDSPPVITAGAWQFVAVVHDVVNRTRSIYVNGGTTPVAQATYTGSWGTDPGPASVGGEVDGTSEGVPRWRFDGEIDEVTIFQRPLSGVELAALRNETHICASYEDPNQPAFAFNCVAPGADAINGRLPTRLVGSSFVFDVVALQDSDNDNVADAIEPRFAEVEDRVVSVELVDTSAAGSCQALPALSPPASQSVLFQAADAGRKSSAGFSLARAYPSLGCRVTDNNETPAVVGCSTDRFSVRPAAFTLQTPALNNAGSSGAPAHEVEAAFELSVSSTPGYGGTPAIAADPLQAHAGAVAVGTLGGGFSAADIASGVATGNGFSYSEVGSFRFLPEAIRDSTFTAVDQSGDCIPGSVANVADGSGLIGCDFANPVASPWVGRFIPGRFEVVVPDHGALDNTCSGFSYAGTAIGYATDPAILISARAASGAITRNYTG
ncbi:MAG: LamG domain-containing protein, partial [Pseudomonadales bacterium]|nr:LamG domain-containing protein [Pseudomonadales bacterium]